MDSPLIKKMEQFTSFSNEDRALLNRLSSSDKNSMARARTSSGEGEHSPDIHIVMTGLACRYKHLEDGTRQIMAFLVPGDPCDSEIFILNQMDHTIGTLTPSIIASVSGRGRRGPSAAAKHRAGLLVEHLAGRRCSAPTHHR